MIITDDAIISGSPFWNFAPKSAEKLGKNFFKIYTARKMLIVQLNYQSKTFVPESARLTSLARLDIVKALLNYRKRFTTKKEADSMFLDLYNSEMYLPKLFKFIDSISICTPRRLVKSWKYWELSVTV